MFSIRNIIATVGAALFSGAIGFFSASHLQTQEAAQTKANLELENRNRLAQVEQQHRLELQQITDERRQERTFALYGEWHSAGMLANRERMRALLARRPDFSYAQFRTNPRVSAQDRAALDAVLRHYARIDDYAAAGLIDQELARNLLGPNALYMVRQTPRLLAGINLADPAAEDGVMIIAARGARLIAPQQNAGPTASAQASGPTAAAAQTGAAAPTGGGAAAQFPAAGSGESGMTQMTDLPHRDQIPARGGASSAAPTQMESMMLEFGDREGTPMASTITTEELPRSQKP
ncbi:MAG: hypothetical protein GC189_07935 [Alphaproteobacteria bacterium]|nr:hypothetical protein [Alphaproteobacteria bacterium]